MNLNQVFRQGSDRKTKCYVLTIGDHELFISYETVMAYRGPRYPRGIRRANNWGPTTGRHMGEMDCADWPVEGEFVAMVEDPGTWRENY